MYIKKLLKELDLYKQSKFPFYTDNQNALFIADNLVFHEKSKHIAIRFHYIRDIIVHRDLDLIYIKTDDNKADGFTKGLSKVEFTKFLEQNSIY